MPCWCSNGLNVGTSCCGALLTRSYMLSHAHVCFLAGTYICGCDLGWELVSLSDQGDICKLGWSHTKIMWMACKQNRGLEYP